MIKDKRIFITGGAGFIGTKLIERLYENNTIIVYDKLERNSLKSTNLQDSKNINLIEGDVLDQKELFKAVGEYQPQMIIHMAAIAGVDNVISRPIETMEVNFLGTYNLLKALEPNISKIERFIDFSTSEVFGSYAYRVSEKDTTNLAPVGEARWTYQVSKIASEHLAHSYYNVYGLPVVSIRPFNIYGPGQVGAGAIQTFIKKAIANEEIQIHGDGSQIRSWCYVDDIVDGILLSMEKQEAIGNSFNIGNSRSIITIQMLAELIKMLCNSESKITNVPKGYTDVELRIPDVNKAEKLLGFNAKVDLTEGIIKTADWYRSKGV